LRFEALESGISGETPKQRESIGEKENEVIVSCVASRGFKKIIIIYK
jgi:hypothetical protein